MAVTTRLKFDASVGVIVSWDRVQAEISTEFCVAVAVKLCPVSPVPSLRVAPTGMAFTTKLDSAFLSPSRELTVGEARLRAMAVFSTPTAAGPSVASVGAAGSTVIGRDVLAMEDLLPSPSVSCAVTPSVMPPAPVGTIARLAIVQPALATSMKLFVPVAVNECAPSVRVTPLGMPLITSEVSVFESPEALATVTPMSSGIGPFSAPETLVTDRVGAAGLMTRDSVADTDLTLSVAVAVSVKLTSLGSVTLSLA